tara:strand:- start:1464 stop:3248 length:1785 start_codon:yes stop_codon:yes gene_type:complete
MAKAAGVKKGSKLNFYKFVGTEEPKGKGSNPFGATTHFNNNTTAINQIGESVNGIMSMVAELKELELARLEQMNKKKPALEPKPEEKKEKKGNPLVNFAKGVAKKGGSFLEGILGMLGNMLKMFVAIPAMMWLADPANKEKLVTVIKVLGKIGKFVFDFMKFGVLTLIDGLYNMFSDDTSWLDKILGFGKALIGLGTVLLGVRWLKNPLKLVKDIGRGINMLIKVITKAATGKSKGTKTLLKQGMRFIRGKAAGGFVSYLPLKKAASGGWITGPQTGYPVSLDGGMTTSFIGHGTEYVSQKADGGAFVVPFDTPATKRTPSLTNTRMKEAKRLGFADGGLLNITPPTFTNKNSPTFNTSTFNTKNEYSEGGKVTNHFFEKGGQISNNFFNESYNDVHSPFEDMSFAPPVGNTVMQRKRPLLNFAKGGDFKPLLNFAVGGEVNPSYSFAAGGQTNKTNNHTVQQIQVAPTPTLMERKTKMGMGFRRGGQTSRRYQPVKSNVTVTHQTESRNQSVNDVKSQALASVEATAQVVSQVNSQNQQAIAQATSATTGGGGDPETIVQGLPGSGTVNVNGVLKSTATVLNSNNNFMKGLIK